MFSLINLAGIPAYIACDLSCSLETRLLFPITQLSGILPPFIIRTCAPNQTWLPITTEEAVLIRSCIVFKIACESPLRISISFENIQSFPIIMDFPSVDAICPLSIVKSSPIIISQLLPCSQKCVLLTIVCPPPIKSRLLSPIIVI